MFTFNSFKPYKALITTKLITTKLYLKTPRMVRNEELQQSEFNVSQKVGITERANEIYRQQWSELSELRDETNRCISTDEIYQLQAKINQILLITTASLFKNDHTQINDRLSLYTTDMKQLEMTSGVYEEECLVWETKHFKMDSILFKIPHVMKIPICLNTRTYIFPDATISPTCITTKKHTMHQSQSRQLIYISVEGYDSRTKVWTPIHADHVDEYNDHIGNVSNNTHAVFILNTNYFFDKFNIQIFGSDPEYCSSDIFDEFMMFGTVKRRNAANNAPMRKPTTGETICVSTKDFVEANLAEKFKMSFVPQIASGLVGCMLWSWYNSL
eukprot:177194_1